MPIDYSKGKIYTIRYKKDPTLIYVGSTVCDLTKRMWGHRASIHREKDYNMMLYKKMRETDDIDNWYIELYEEYPCDNKEQLHKREGEIIRDISTLNVRIAGRTQKEYREQNKDNLRLIEKEWRDNNKQRKYETDKAYREANKETIKQKKKEYREANKEAIRQKKKEYAEANKEVIKQRKKDYYEANKEKILIDRSKNKILCDCGSECLKSNIGNHLKSKKHQDFINNQQAATN